MEGHRIKLKSALVQNTSAPGTHWRIGQMLILVDRQTGTACRLWIAVGLAFLAACQSINEEAAAQDYPNRPILLEVGFVPGSYPDICARLLGSKLSNVIGQPVVIENRSGASGNIASEFVAHARPDGYTLGALVDAQWGLAPAIFKSLAFDPIRDFEPVSAFSLVPVYIVINSSFPASNFDEFVSVLKQNPGKYNYGTPGAGTVHNLAFETVKAQLGLDVVHVPYRGTSQVIPALLTGEVLIAVQGYPQLQEFVEKGVFKALAVSSGKRSVLAPSVPTFRELGINSEFDLGTEYPRAGQNSTSGNRDAGKCHE
jgi:tripartite-type tricarboxylate transporter receptor subunit TctC